MVRSRAFFLILVLLLPQFAFAEDYVTYVAVPGDTISQILFDHDIGPIYGRKGYLLITLGINPTIKFPGDELAPGQLVRLPVGALRKVASEGKPGVVSSLPPKVEPEKIAAAPASILNSPIVAPVPVPPPPVAAQAPSPTPAPAPNTFTPDSRFVVEGGFGFYDLEGIDKSNGSSGKLLSSSSPSLSLNWEQNWTPEYSSLFFLDMRSIQFQPDRSGIILDHANVFNSDFGIGGKKAITPNLKIGVRAGAEQAMSYRAESLSELNISQVGVVFLEPGIDYKFIEKKPFALSAHAAAQFIGSGGDLQNGYGYNAFLRLTQERPNKGNWYCEVGYNERRQNTSYLELAQKSVNLNCGYGWLP
jgi:hypothetical protein